MNKKLYPLTFVPATVEKAWGRELFQISTMGEGLEGEIGNGFLAGNTLADLLEVYMGELVGDSIFEYFGLQFPVLIKLLEIEGRLSVQIHPDEQTAMERYGSCGKDEWWYVVSASPEAGIHLGFKEECSASEMYGRCKDGSVVGLLNEFTPKEGEIYRIKAGTVHSCSGKLTLLEIQQPSDVTLRLYDWGRENDPATAREMHLEEALDCIDYSKYDEKPLKIGKTKSGEELSTSSHFSIKALKVKGSMKINPEDYESCTLYCCIDGKAAITAGAGERVALKSLEPVIVPSSCDEFAIVSEEGATLLQIHAGNVEETDSYLEDNGNGQH